MLALTSGQSVSLWVASKGAANIVIVDAAVIVREVSGL
jgi:hypothetical protein